MMELMSLKSILTLCPAEFSFCLKVSLPFTWQRTRNRYSSKEGRTWTIHSSSRFLANVVSFRNKVTNLTKKTDEKKRDQ